MIIFYKLFDIFSGTRGLIDLIPIATCQTTCVKSLERQDDILWLDMKITKKIWEVIFWSKTPLAAIMCFLKLILMPRMSPKRLLQI